ncbi:DNA sulfur modification protein DndE [Kocuria sp. M1R5S2]|uniref:DNA sulfur modification protein DndE n=1 Tax=Kocuria rhizosphaerae TaxID=3376285 RepID=UPI0037995900
MSLETVRLSEQGKNQLIKLKRATGIKQWNILCRWALCTSLSDPTPPLVRDVVADSNVEMTWKTFAGAQAPIYEALIAQRAHAEGESELSRTASAHIHRGIGVLSSQVSDMTSLLSGALIQQAN